MIRFNTAQAHSTATQKQTQTQTRAVKETNNHTLTYVKTQRQTRVDQMAARCHLETPPCQYRCPHVAFARAANRISIKVHMKI